MGSKAGAILQPVGFSNTQSSAVQLWGLGSQVNLGLLTLTV